MPVGVCFIARFCPLILMILTTMAQADSLREQIDAVVPLGHTDSIYAVAFSKDGKLAFSLSLDQSLKVWEVASGREIKTWKMDSDQVRALSVSPNGYWVASGDKQQGIKLWDVATGKKIQYFKGTRRRVNSLAFSPDGKYLLAGGEDKKISLWRVKDGALLYSRRVHRKRINQVTFSADGKWIASASDDRSIIISYAHNGRPAMILKGHRQAVTSLDFSPDGKQIVSAGRDQQVVLWDITRQKIIKHFNGHKGVVNSVQFSRDGSLILSASDDQRMILWDVKKGTIKQVFKGHQGAVLSAAFAPDNYLVLSGSRDNTLRLWGSEQGNQIRVFNGQASRLNDIVITPDQHYLFSAHNDKSLKLWNLQTGAAIRIFNRHKARVNTVSVSDNGLYAASGGSDRQIVIWRVADGRRVRKLRGHQGRINQVLFTHDNLYLLSASSDRSIRLWDIKKRRTVRIFKGHQRAVISIALAPDGKHFVSTSKDNTLRLWNIKTGRSHILFAEEYPLRKVLYSRDGGSVFVSGWDLLQINHQNGQIIRRFGKGAFTHQSDITALALSTDGKWLASGGFDNRIIIWSVQDGTIKQQFAVKQGGILSLAFAAFSHKPHLFSAGGDGVIRLWDLRADTEVLRMVGSKQGEWIVMTPDGYYDNSPEGSELIHWVERDGMHSYSFEQFEQFFKRPDIIHARLQGKLQIGSPPPPIPAPPVVEMAEHLQTRQTNKKQVHLHLSVRDQHKFDLLRVFVNGRMIQQTEVGARHKELDINIPLVQGANQLTLIGFNQDGLSSDPRYLSVISTASQQQQSDLYLLTIGISQYQNLGQSAQLNYAHTDARHFAQRFNNAAHSLYRHVYEYHLLNQQASADNILAKLEMLANKIQSQDVLMFFFAGHGFKQPDKLSGQEIFYLETYDIDPDNINRTALNWDKIREKLQVIKGRILMFLDACHSGSISNETVVPNNQLAEKLFSRQAGGIMVFSAAKGRQFAQESPYFGSGEGLFSYALYKALRQDNLLTDYNGNGYIEFSELVNTVQQFVDQKSDGQQTPWLSHKELFGDLPIARALGQNKI